MDDKFIWTRNEMLEIELVEEDDFLRIKETLQRIGIGSNKTNTLTQSCHILHKREKYYIVHFKEMFILNKSFSDISYGDIERRNAIAELLEEWGLCTIKWKQEQYSEKCTLRNIKIIPYSQKKDWELVSKIEIGIKK